MKYRTSKLKFEESEYFLSQIFEHYSEDSDVAEYYLNAFVISCRSALDYVIQDFLYTNKIRNMKTTDFRNSRKRKEVLGEKKEFEEFSLEYEKKWKEMLEDPEMKYFLEKRKNIVHQMKDGVKMLMYEQIDESSDKTIKKRCLEASLDEIIHPELFNNFQKTDEVFWKAPYFKERYPNSDEFEFAIRHCDMRPFLKSFFKKCQKFTEQFYKNYLPDPPKREVWNID